MTLPATTNSIDNIRRQAREAIEVIMPDYVLSVSKSDTPNEDKRKALETMAKLAGFDKEKTDNLMTVHWTINGGVVTMDVTPAATHSPLDQEVTDVIPKEVAAENIPSSQNEPVNQLTPEDAFLSTFQTMENLLEGL